MKRTVRSLLALLLCALLLAGSALAAASPDAAVFYAQLTDAQKEYYDDLNTPEVLAKIRSGEEISLPELSGSYSSSEEIQALSQAFMNDIGYAFAALELEHPELFWIRGYASASSYRYGGGSFTLQRYLTVEHEVNWADGSRSVDADIEALSAAVQALAAAAKEQDGVYAQLLYVHDRLTESLIYNSKAAAEGSDLDYLPWTPLSALLGERMPVCEGYSRAFKLVCDELGIPCILVDGYANGGGHMWNQVKLNGQWYAVDVTWDDPVVSGITDVKSGYENHNYFLVGSDTPVDGVVTFSENHTALGNRFSDIIFSTPALSRTAYDPDAAPLPTITRQDIPGTGTSYASTQTVLIGDTPVELPAYALKDARGYPTNYVRLRDLAALLDGTAASFDVLWSAAEKAITIVPQHSYDNPNGSENNLPFSGDQPYSAYLQDTTVGAVKQPLTAFQIQYQGGGHTFYQLRDMGKALNFNVGWDPVRKMIFIEPDQPYTDAN